MNGHDFRTICFAYFIGLFDVFVFVDALRALDRG